MNKKVDKKEIITKGTKTLKEFKTFISKGNVVDLAVGVIIGSTFGKIVSSLVNDILMPIIGIIIGGIDFSNLTIQIKDATIKYGIFIQNIIDFLIVEFCIFIFIKLINKVSKKEEEKKEKVVSEEAKILKEIRDILKEKNQ